MTKWVAVKVTLRIHPPPKKKQRFLGGGDECWNIFVTTHPMDLKIFLGHLYHISDPKKIFGAYRNFYRSVLDPQVRTFV